MVIKKILKSIIEQLQINVHYVTKNNPLEGYDLFNGTPPVETINSTQQVAVEFIFVDGYLLHNGKNKTQRRNRKTYRRRC